MGQDRGTGANSWSGELVCAAMDQCREGIAVIDLSGRFVWINAAFARMHGYHRSELLRSHIGLLFSPASMLALAAANRELWQTGEFAGEVRQVRQGGTEFVAFLRSSLVKDESGEAIGAVMVVRDITEAKLADRIMRLSRDELSRRSAKLEARISDQARYLKKTKNELRRRARQLAQVDTALRIMIAERHDQQRRLEKTIRRNLATTVRPVIGQLKAQNLPVPTRLLIQSLEFSINNVFSSITDLFDESEIELTPRETQLCELIRSGLTSKQIAAVLGVSPFTVITHRANLRKRLGLVGSQSNLSVYLKAGSGLRKD